MNNIQVDDFIHAHPRETLWLVVIGIFLVWQSLVAVLGIIIYFFLRKFVRLPWWVTLSVGIVIAFITVSLRQYYEHVNLPLFIRYGFHLNLIFWKCLFANHVSQAFVFQFQQALDYTIGFPLLLVGIINVIHLIPGNPYQSSMQALKDGVDESVVPEISNKKVEAILKKDYSDDNNGTMIGVSKYTGKHVVIADHDVNHVLLVLGTTGGGKTVTIGRFYRHAITKGYPLVVIDAKPDEKNISRLRALTEKYNRPFYGFNCENFLPYDPLESGGYTELKDKIISLKDEWSSDYYKSIAEAYLQTTLQVLIRSKKSFDFKMVADCLNYNELVMLVREIEDPILAKRVESLEHYDRKDITGLQAHLNILIHSELGHFFDKTDQTFNLVQAIQQNAVVYFALPALRFPSFSKVLGKLVINDLKAVMDRHNNISQRVFTVFDEFSVFAGEQVLNLVNMGRGKGVHAIFGTQGLAELDKVDDAFKNQVMNCVNTIICHRLNDQVSAETVSAWVGTKSVFTVTAQISTKQPDAGMGSVRRNKEFIVHPDEIKQGLQTGEAFYITKVGKFRKDKVKIKFT